jgi:inosine-uridine nucleoside N-ribohydrolase
MPFLARRPWAPLRRRASLAVCAADVETRGELTRGMSVFDTRWVCKTRPNVDLVVGVDAEAVRKYVATVLGQLA